MDHLRYNVVCILILAQFLDFVGGNLVEEPLVLLVVCMLPRKSILNESRYLLVECALMSHIANYVEGEIFSGDLEPLLHFLELALDPRDLHAF